jgi:signal transduction histidine kinase
MTDQGDEDRVVLPRPRFDDLLNELEARLGAVLRSRDRVHALLEAVVSIESELDLDTVLRRIVEAAAGLVEARYGALGVIGPGGDRMARLVTVGVSQEEIDAIGHWPTGHGLLGLLIKDPQLLRLSDLQAHPDSSGFPHGHPPMRRFLGVPVRVRDEVFGNLYLAEKERGGEFDEDDETVVTALAAAAGVAIENARLYREARGRERWLRASAEVSTSLLSGTDPGEVLTLITHRARQICEASFATMAVVRGEDFVIEAAEGAHAELLRGYRVPVDQAVAGPVFRSGIALALDGTERDRRPRLPEAVRTGPALIVPMGSGKHTRGVLSVVNPPEGAIFGQTTRRLLETFAGQAAVALELAERRRDAERLVVLEDRDRIAKDLHDTVIQRLFATAMNLMSVVKVTESRDVSGRVQRAVDDLDETIRQIRSTIFALQTAPDERSLRARIQALADGAVEGLGFAPAVRLDGLLDTMVSEHVGDQLLAVLSEALSNAARHARARHVAITVDVGDAVVLRVADDGVGIGGGGRRSGLRNMAARAEALGGEFRVCGGDPEGRGTVVEWRVPLEPGAG